MSERSFQYSAFGLAISSQRPLPGLHAPTGGGIPVAVDFQRALDIAAPDAEPHRKAEFETHWHLQDGRWLSRYGEGRGVPLWSLEAQPGGTRLDVRWSDPSQLQDIPTIIQGAGLAMVLHLQGEFILHASAVAVGGRAILVIGDSGAGKSSTAAALVHSGCPLISDDMAVLDFGEGGVTVRRGPLRMRVYEDSARAAGWRQPLPKLFNHPVFDDKRYVDVANAFPEETAEIAAIFVLAPRGEPTDQLRLEPLSPRAALGPLLRNIYRAPFLDAARTKLAAQRCACIAGHVPVVQVHRPDSLDSLPETARAMAGFAAA